MTKTASTEALKNKIANQQTEPTGAPGTPPAANKAVTPYRKVEAYLKKLEPQITAALPNTGISAERLARITLTTVKLNPGLLENIDSLLGAVMQSAALGLEPGLLGSCYFIPYKDKKTGITTVSFQIGYRGLIDLVTRRGEVLKIQAKAVYTNDFFDYENGTEEFLKHKPARGDRGQIEAFYAIAKLKNGEHLFEVMDVHEINKIRNRYSISYKFQGDNSIWAKNYEAMAKKTVLKQLVKFLPISVDTLNEIAQDETVKKDINEPAAHVEPEILEAEHHVIEPDPAAATPADPME